MLYIVLHLIYIFDLLLVGLFPNQLFIPSVGIGRREERDPPLLKSCHGKTGTFPFLCVSYMNVREVLTIKFS